MSRKIIRRAVASVPFAWAFRPGTPAVAERTVSYSDAVRLGVSGTIISGKDGTPVSVIIPAEDATPRYVMLRNALTLTAGNPTGKVSKSGVRLSDATLRTIIADHGWKTIGAMFPTDGSAPTEAARAACDPAESAAFSDYLRGAAEIEDFGSDDQAPTL